MGREVLIAALCWFTIGVCATGFRNNGLQSVSRLYGGLPRVGVYASAAPHGAYSFHSPIIAPFRDVPNKEIFSFQNMNDHLKDSYGNRFVETKQSQQAVPFKPFPQKYVPLQELPAHFTQPIAAPAFPGIKQVEAPQINYGSQYKLPLHSLQNTPSSQPTVFPFSQLVYKQNTASSQQTAFPASQGASAFVNNLNNLANLSPHPVAHTQFRGPLINLPVPGQAYHQLPAYASYRQPFHYDSNIIHNQNVATPIPTAQQQSSSNKAIYASQQNTNYNKEPQRYHSEEEEGEEQEEPIQPMRQVVRHKDEIHQKVPLRETTITSFHNGVKTSVNLKTKPPLPLLDISLLEPLTFDNPLVPQVQHFLPRLSQATYSKLPGSDVVSKKHKPILQKNKSYDFESSKVKPKKIVPKKKPGQPRVPVQNVYYDEVASASTIKPFIANESPEIVYEIDTPNHKETYTEQKINYNKETKSDPVHITYGSRKKKDPVHYTYIHSSKEPLHIKEVHYEGKGEGPKPQVSKINSNDSKNDKKYHNDSADDGSAEDVPLTHYHSDHHDDENIKHHGHHDNKHHQNNYPEFQNHHREKGSSHFEESQAPPHHKSGQRKEEFHHSSSNESQDELAIPQFKPIQFYTKTSSGTFRPINDIEEEIRIAAPIKVNPGQHVQQQTESQPQNPPQQDGRSSLHQSGPQHENHHNLTPTGYEKNKSVTIQHSEETPESAEHEHKGKFGHDEDNEKEFEKAYKNAAFGFPAFDKNSESGTDFVSPVRYGATNDHNSYDFKNSPFEQYHSQSDNFPKSTRLSYKELMDKMKGDYFTDLSINKPESIADYYKKKTDYYKLYKNQKPENYIGLNHQSPKNEKTNEKYSAIPYSFYPTQAMNMKQMIAQYKATPFVQEIDYSKALPRDSSAYSTQPFQRYKSNTFFVEPQFQYGFEPLSLPRLLDSELATMASNNSPESENPGTRKKFYKENFYIKKTSTTDAQPSS